VRRAPDDVLSSVKAVQEAIQTRYTLGKDIASNRYHVAVVRSQLTRNIGSKFSEIRNELAQAFTDNIPCTDGGAT
jgi:hypothetical protein